MYVSKVFLCEGRKESLMQKSIDLLRIQWPLSQSTSIGPSFLWQESECTREHSGKTMVRHLIAAAWKREKLYDVLPFKRTGALASDSKCVCVCVCVWLSAHLYCPPFELPLITETYFVIKKNKKIKKKNRHIKTECLQSHEKCSLGALVTPVFLWDPRKKGGEMAGELRCQSLREKKKTKKRTLERWNLLSFGCPFVSTTYLQVISCRLRIHEMTCNDTAYSVIQKLWFFGFSPNLLMAAESVLHGKW